MCPTIAPHAHTASHLFLQPCCDPARPPFHASARTVFQQLEVDYCLQRPRNDVWPSRAQQVPVVRLFGVNDAGGCLYVDKGGG